MGFPFSELRISATVGLAIERFTHANAKTVALIGSGRLALPILEPACALRSIERVLVYSRSAENRERFARRASEKLKVRVSAGRIGASKRSIKPILFWSARIRPRRRCSANGCVLGWRFSALAGPTNSTTKFICARI